MYLVTTVEPGRSGCDVMQREERRGEERGDRGDRAPVADQAPPGAPHSWLN